MKSNDNRKGRRGMIGNNYPVRRIVLGLTIMISVSLLSFATAFLPPNTRSLTCQTHQTTICKQSTTSRASQQGSPTQESNRSSNSTFAATPDKRTLYDILGAQPNETREELKQKYVRLAKLSHPDAIRGRTSEIDFTEIAAAWKILSDPLQRKRYDRSIQAEVFSQEVQEWAERFSRQAAPAAKSFGKVAIPFLRRTTAATLASIQAAANDLSKKDKRNEPLGAFRSAMQAARRAGQYVDSLEFYEKAQTLEDRAKKEALLAAELQQQLQEIADKRLKLALHTPGSGLTSAEAMVVYAELNRTVNDTLSVWDRAMLKHTLEFEIQELKKAESIFVEVQQADSKAQQAYQQGVQACLKAKKDLSRAEFEAEEARKALEAALLRVTASKTALDDATRAVAQAEAQAKKSDYEMERFSLELVKQSEKVRNILRAKEKEANKSAGGQQHIYPDEVSAERLKELKELRRDERLLSQNQTRLEATAARLFSRAEKLRLRAQELEKLEGK